MASNGKRFNVGGVIMPRPFKIRRLGHFGFNAIRMDESLDGEAEDRLLAPDGVAPHDRTARRLDRLGRGPQHGLDGREREPLGEGRDVERGRDPAAHREHVAARVGRRDGPEVGRVVDERREEVGRRDQCEVVGEAVDRGVVERCEAHEQGAVDRSAESLHERRQR